MADWYDNYILVEGKRDQVLKLVEGLEDESLIAETDRTSSMEIVTSDLTGSSDNSYAEINIEVAWGPAEDTVTALREAFPDLEISANYKDPIYY